MLSSFFNNSNITNQSKSQQQRPTWWRFGNWQPGHCPSSAEANPVQLHPQIANKLAEHREKERVRYIPIESSGVELQPNATPVSNQPKTKIARTIPIMGASESPLIFRRNPAVPLGFHDEVQHPYQFSSENYPHGVLNFKEDLRPDSKPVETHQGSDLEDPKKPLLALSPPRSTSVDNIKTLFTQVSKEPHIYFPTSEEDVDEEIEVDDTPSYHQVRHLIKDSKRKATQTPAAPYASPLINSANKVLIEDLLNNTQETMDMESNIDLQDLNSTPPLAKEHLDSNENDFHMSADAKTHSDDQEFIEVHKKKHRKHHRKKSQPNIHS